MEIRPFSFDTIFIVTFVGAYPSYLTRALLSAMASAHYERRGSRACTRDFEENALKKKVS